MPNFVLVDSSLKEVGGHFHAYAVQVLAAAKRLGYQPVLAANARFSERSKLPDAWQVLTPYRARVYVHQNRSESRLRRRQQANEQGRWFGAVARWRDRFHLARYAIRRRRVAREFARATAEWFQRCPLETGDQVLVATATPLEVAALGRFFAGHPAARQADWHVQFHFPAHEPQMPSEPSSARMAPTSAELHVVKQAFRDCLSAFPEGRLHFHATTAPLAEHLNQLGVAPFRTLPYPVDAGFRPAADCATPTPLRVGCLGGIRGEKGHAHLASIVAAVWDDHFRTNRLQLVLQTARAGDVPPALRPLAARTPAATPNRNVADKIALVRWPLAEDDYRQLILTSDIGLLLYDPREYALRCSGVCVEMLAAGVPLIVLAGTWLADQIAASSRPDQAQPQAGATTPLGSVGLIADRIEQVPDLLREMVRHYAHYRRTAAEFARSYGPAHSGEQVIRHLLLAAGRGGEDKSRRVA